MKSFIQTETFTAPPTNIKEIIRYMGDKGITTETELLINECLNECVNSIKYLVCYTIVDVNTYSDHTDLYFFETKSTSLIRNLSKCDKAVIFAATIGIGIDRLIAKYSRLSPSKALCFQAIGAERIEALCDVFCNNIALQYGRIHPRFSPGYGDFNIDFQNDIFRYLDCSRRIGLTLNSSLIMSPSKSVTAIVGIERR